MAPKKKKMPAPKRAANIAAEIENAGVVMEQPITQTLETNFMPYAMSVIISRAIPEIDGFKPAHRKLLYTMYKMGHGSTDEIGQYRGSDHAVESAWRRGDL